MEEPKFFSPFEEIKKHGGKLPHWQQVGGTYFITFRLADSIPKQQLDEWREDRDHWKATHPEPWSRETEIEFHRQFSGRIDEWLDEGVGGCLLRNSVFAQIVERALLHFDGHRYLLHSFVIMPNHVHAMFSLNPSEMLDSLLQSWKGFTAREINRMRKRQGPVWQKNYFDRLIRDWDHFFRVARYIHENPGRVRLTETQFHLYESDMVKEMLGEV